MKSAFQPLRRPSRRAGFTLTELAIVLGVMSLVLGAIWTVAASVYTTRKIAQAVQQIETIASNVRGIYATRGSFPTATVGTDITAAMITANALPTDLQLTATTATDAWGGAATVTVPTAQSFRVTYYSTPANICLGLAQQLGSGAGANGAGATKLTVNGVTATALDLTASTSTSSAISTLCATAGSGTGASTALDFSIR